jgi:2-dehydropantoate 2-reductase
MKTHSFGEYLFEPEHVFASIDQAASCGVVWDFIVVTTKALPDVSDDSVLIERVVTRGGQSAIVLIQNGVGVEELYKTRFGDEVPLLSAVTVVSAEQVEPGVVVQNRWTRISIGPYTGRIEEKQDEVTAKFVGILQAGGIKDAEAYDEKGLQAVRWHKIAINAAMNPSAVLSNGTGNARMATDADLRMHLRECMLEVFRGAEAAFGSPLPEHLARPDRILTSTERNTEGRPSMLGDWERGSALELEVILGNPIRLARAAGVEMPRLHAMYALLKMAQRRRDEAARGGGGGQAEKCGDVVGGSTDGSEVGGAKL